MFCELNNFPFVATLTQNWRVVRSEFNALAPQNMMPWPERFLYDKGYALARSFRRIASVVLRARASSKRFPE